MAGETESSAAPADKPADQSSGDKTRDKAQVDNVLAKIANNVQTNRGPYTSGAFDVAQQELKRAITSDALKAAEAKEKVVAQAIIELTKENEIERKFLESKFRNDTDELKKALEQQATATQQAIDKAQKDADEKYNQKITELIRKSEESLQAKQAQQIEAIMLQEKEMRLQFDQQMKQLQESHEQRLQQQLQAAEKNAEKTVSDLKAAFGTELTNMRIIHEEEYKDSAVRTAADNDKLRNEFNLLLQKVDSCHKEEMSRIQAKADLEVAERRRQEKDMADKFNNQVLLLQQQTSDAAAKQLADFARIQKDTEAKQREAQATMMATMAGPLAAATATVGKVANAVPAAGDLLGGLGGALGPVTGLLSSVLGGVAENGILKLELCSIM